MTGPTEDGGSRGPGTGVPEVTVVIPTKDRPDLLGPTLRSVLDQQDVDLEVVVVDDGSRDPVADAGVIGLDDARVRIVRNEVAGGVAAARNRGIGSASAPWIATLDDDDLWVPDKLATQLAAARASGRRWAFSGAVHFLPGPRVWHVGAAPAPDEVRRRLPHENVVPAGSSNVLAERVAYLEVGGFDEALHQLADWDMWCKLLRLGVPATIAAPAVAYRLHPNNMVLASTEGLLDEVDVIERRTVDLRVPGEALDRTGFHDWVGSMLMRAGRRADARRAYLQAVRDGNRRRWLRVARTYVPLDDIRSRVLRRPPPSAPPAFEIWLESTLGAG